jgi:protein O-GlcNAc transferase
MKDIDADEQIDHGDALRDSGEIDQAIEVYRRVIAAFPRHPLGHYKLGTAFMCSERDREAEAAFRKALDLAPGFAEAANNLGILLAARGEYEETEALYRKALAEHVDFAPIHINFGDTLTATARPLEALYHYRRAHVLDPDSAHAAMLVGQALLTLDRTHDAVAPLKRALELDSSLASAWTNLGRCHHAQGQVAESMEASRRAVSIDPEIMPAWHNWLLASNYADISREEAFKLHQEFGRHMAQRPGPGRYADYSNSPDPDRRLRVGFVSGDLRRHSVSYFIEGPLRHLDPTRIEAWAYFSYPWEDYRAEELKPLFHKWHTIHGMDDAKLAELIRHDRIDILIDLSGHTSNNRLPVFAVKPAPVQLTWIGYPNTTGLQSIDYRISDDRVDPPETASRYFSETLIHLPDCFLCYSPPKEAPAVSRSPHLGAGKITFGSFNAITKIGDETLMLWARVLDAVPESTLVLKASDIFNDPERRAHLLDRIRQLEIDPERIRLLAYEKDISDHLAGYDEIDIGLDPVRYNGTTTTCEALWMGVPVVTLAGDRHASRVGSSLLSAAGLAELVARDADDYVRICTELAQDSARLSGLRSTMRQRMLTSPLLDAAGMARRLERALYDVWRMWCETAAEPWAPAASDSASKPIAPPKNTPADGLIQLHVGGTQAKPGWKILNVNSGPDVDFVGDIRDLSRFGGESCEAVYASHVLEHVGQQEIVPVLLGIHRILAPGGRLYVSVPDMDALCKQFLDPEFEVQQRYHVMRMIFGGQTDAFDFHQIGLNLDFMVDFLRQAGFYSVEQVESLGIFDDTSDFAPYGTPVSLNLIAVK